MESNQPTNVTFITKEDIEKANYLDLRKAYKTIETNTESVLLYIVSSRIGNLSMSMREMIHNKKNVADIISLIKSKLDDIQFLLAIENSKDFLSILLFALTNLSNETPKNLNEPSKINENS